MLVRLVCAKWKRILMIVLWAAICLNIVYILQRTMLYDYCDVQAIIKEHRTLQYDAAMSMNDGCTFERNDSTSGDPPETNWCMYDDEVDLRIIIMTFNRWESLIRLLRFVT